MNTINIKIREQYNEYNEEKENDMRQMKKDTFGEH